MACFSSGWWRPAGVLVKGLAWEEGEAPGSDPSPPPSPAVGPGASVYSGGKIRLHLPDVLNSNEIRAAEASAAGGPCTLARL